MDSPSLTQKSDCRCGFVDKPLATTRGESAASQSTDAFGRVGDSPSMRRDYQPSQGRLPRANATQHAAIFRSRPWQRGARWCGGLFSCDLSFLDDVLRLLIDQCVESSHLGLLCAR